MDFSPDPLFQISHVYPKIMVFVTHYTLLPVRDWSLITGRGGYKTGGGGHVKFYPYEKGGQKRHAEGGAQQVFGSFLRGSLKF